MPVDIDPAELPVLLLYNIEPSWTAVEKEEAVKLAMELGRSVADIGYPTTYVPLTDANLAATLDGFDPQQHLVFNWCESIPGIPHSESRVARELERLRFTFTGADANTLTLSEDKGQVKQVLDQAGIPSPAWRIYDRTAAKDWDRFPAIVKPLHEHCSEGITTESVVFSGQELEKRIHHVLNTYSQPALVEDFIDGREFHVSLWGNGRIEMLPPVEMDFSLFDQVRDRLCTYEAKFVPGSTHYEGIQTLLPAPLSEPELQAMEQVCQEAYKAVGCRDYGRIDLRVRDGIYYILDVNPNADISSDASLACAAELVGYSYGEAASRIIRLAAGRLPTLGPESLPTPHE
jgi:D-alanine-D-alanine ligase